MAKTKKMVTLTLPGDFVGQVSEGIEALIEQWDYTARCLEFGVFEQDCMIRECSDESEAKDIAKYYRKISKDIWEQMNEQ